MAATMLSGGKNPNFALTEPEQAPSVQAELNSDVARPEPHDITAAAVAAWQNKACFVIRSIARPMAAVRSRARTG